MSEPTLSIATLLYHDACDLPERIKRLSAHLGRKPSEDEEIPLSDWWVTTQDLIDRIWSLCAIPGGTVIAAKVARRAAVRATAAVKIAHETCAYAYTTETIARKAVRYTLESLYRVAGGDLTIRHGAASGADTLAGCDPDDARLVRGSWRWPQWCPLCEARLVRADEPYPPTPEVSS